MPLLVQNIILIIFYLVVPALVIHFAGKFLLLQKAGNVIVIYVIGLIVGNIGILGDSLAPIQNKMSEISILLSLPLLLASLDFISWAKMAKKSVISLSIGVFSVFVVSIIGYFIFKGITQDTWKITGLLVGVYTGGTPNLASLKEALNVDPNTYIMVHTSDLIASAVYLMFLMTFGKKLIRKWLPYSYEYKGHFTKKNPEFIKSEDYSNFFKKQNLKPTIIIFGVSIVILIIGVLFSKLGNKSEQAMIVILTITTLGILSSTIKPLRKSPKSFELGMYFILVFSLVVSSMADLNKFSIGAIPIFLYITYAITFSLILHVFLARFFKIDADTIIITSTALICSPAFVPVIAGSLNNKILIISGLTIGIIGYAIGNYLGIFTAYLLMP